MADRFKWLGRSTVTRSKEGSGGIALEPGHIYGVADFSADVVGEWIVTGNAEAVTTEAKDTVLDVKSQTVKIKVPKIGANL
jgi:hypothetical protein